MKKVQNKQGARFLREFKDFTIFLQNLWGILAGISVLFPLSNVFMKIIPLDTFDNGGPLVWFSPTLFTTIATVVSLFFILSLFGQRGLFQSGKKRTTNQRQARNSFLTGISLLIIYLAVYYFIATSAYDVLGWESADSIRLIGEIPLLLFYSSFFALLTRSFVLLGMIEFFQQGEEGAMKV